MGRPEGQVEDYLVEQAEARGYICYKWVSPGRLSKSQQLMIPRLREHGADVRVIRSRSEVDVLLEELRK